MAILITGGSGLVGSRLIPRLDDAGFECRALVRGDVSLPPTVQTVRGDLLDSDSLPAAIEGVDAVVHFAAVFRSQDEDAIWRANCDGTRSLVEATKAHAPQARFIMASTSNVYDADSTHPGREDDVCAPTAAYPASKIVAESVVRESGLTWAIPRLPFVYGDGDGHLESMPPLVGRLGLHPAQSFSVAHHRDIAAIVQMALDGALDGRIVNVTDDAPVTVYEMSEVAGQPIDGSNEPLLNPWSGRMDGALARDLGFRPAVPSIRAAARDGLL